MSLIERRDQPYCKERSKLLPWPTLRKSILIIQLVLLLTQLGRWANRQDFLLAFNRSPTRLCPQTKDLLPIENLDIWSEVGQTLKSPEFRQRAVDYLGGAVRVPTESYDEMGPIGVDPRWNVFGPFHEYLSKAFPLVHEALDITKVNTYGLVYHWQGSDSTLDPILFTGHQDTVPVHPSTVDQWKYPPFSGNFDGDRIWGRGSSDDKSGVIGIMTAVELLIGAGFKPTRSVVLAFGFDEEGGGLFGAAYLAKYLITNYGGNAFAMLVDEGSGFEDRYGSVFAIPGVAERGIFDVRLDVAAPGGHSSLPPKHTSIGVLSALLVEYESHPHEVHMRRGSPSHGIVQCYAAHGPSLPKKVKRDVKKSLHSNKALREAEEFFFVDSHFRGLSGTTQAIDMIGGGVKSNALPEAAWAIINHRIATDSSINDTQVHNTELLKDLAVQFNMSFEAFGVDESIMNGPYHGIITLSDAFHAGFEPAPVTPADEPPFQILSGSIKATYNAHRSLQDKQNLIVAPGIMTGNSDTGYYWDLTRHIFRYNHNDLTTSSRAVHGVHTVNESISLDGFIEKILFFTTLTLNADESREI